MSLVLQNRIVGMGRIPSASIGKDFLLFGGSTYSADFSEFAVFGDFFVFCAVSNTELPSADGPKERSGSSLFVDEENDKVYLFGGANGSFQFFSDVWEYDLEARTGKNWFPMLPLPFPEDAMSPIPARLFWMGITPDFEFPTLGDVWEFDIESKMWNDITPTSPRWNIDPHRIHTGAELINGQLYTQGRDIPGGITGCGSPFDQSTSDEIWRLRIVRRRGGSRAFWIPVTNFDRSSDDLEPIKRHGSAVVDDKLYVLGGFDFDCPTGVGDGQLWNNDVWVFEPSRSDARW